MPSFQPYWGHRALQDKPVLGLWKCYVFRKQFAVRRGSILEDPEFSATRPPTPHFPQVGPAVVSESPRAKCNAQNPWRKTGRKRGPLLRPCQPRRQSGAGENQRTGAGALQETPSGCLDIRGPTASLITGAAHALLDPPFLDRARTGLEILPRDM